MSNAPFPAIADDRFYLEISSTPNTSEHSYSTAGAYQRAFFNQQCLDGILTWLKEEISANARVYPSNTALPSIWEVVNGTAITVDNLRLVLVPTLAIDGDELRVPQEWVDIPEFVADYYLAVMLNPDEEWMSIYGYTTHQKLKTIAAYDAGDRTYSLDSDDLIPDINVLWVSRQYSQENLRAEITALPNLPKAQADNLLQRLGKQDIKFPRLQVPFTLWGALLAHGGWRQYLYELRQGITQESIQQRSLTKWLQDGLQNGVSDFAQLFGWNQKMIRLRTGMRGNAPILGFSRQLEIAGNPYELCVFPFGNPESQAWRFELRSVAVGGQIPIGFKLRLLTEDLQPFDNNEDMAIAAVDSLYLDVIVEPGEAIIWETEPLAEGCDREILQF
jgi:Protein of unknown function (DUF1822)